MTRMAIGLWLAGGMNRRIAAAPALRADDWTPTGYAVAVGVAGVAVAETEAFAGADRVAWSTDGATWVDASSQAVGDEVRWLLTGLTGAPSAVIAGLRLRWSAPGLQASASSDVKSLTLPELPSTPRAGDATLADAKATGGDRLTFTLAALPSSDLPLAAIEHQLSSDGVNWGAATQSGAALGEITLTVIAGATSRLRWRGVSALGAGGWSPTLSATPTTGAEESDPVTLLASHTTAIEGQAVHFEPAGLGAAFGTTDREVKEHGDFLYVYSSNPGEDYVFPHMNADMRTANTAGRNRGHYGAHAYVTGGAHTCTLTVTYGGVTRTATRQIVVTPADAFYAGAQTGCWAGPRGDYAGAPTGAKTDFASLEAALTWLSAADNRRLLLRRGLTYPMTSRVQLSGVSQQLGAFGAGDLPVLTRGASFTSWDLVGGPAGGFEAQWTSDGVATNLSISGQSEKGALRGLGDGYTRYDVYADDARLTAGVDYVAPVGGAVTLELLAPPPAGARIRLFRAPLRGALLVMVGLRGTGNVIRDLEFRGGYDPVNPSVFDPDDLSTFDHDISIIAINPSNGINRATVLNCKGSGFRSLIEADGVAQPGDLLLLSGVKATGWYNYGAFTAQHARVCLIGCDLSHEVDAVLEATGKSENVEYQRNAADHGPVRMPFNDRSIIARNRVESRTSWAGDDDASPAQPCWRLMQSYLGGQSYAFAENYSIGGSSPGPNGGPPNAELPLLRCEEAVATHNVFVWTSVTGGSGGGRHSYVWRANLHYVAIASSKPGSLTLLEAKNWGGFADADVATAAPLIYNDTFVILPGAGRPGYELRFGNAAVQQAAGPTNVQATATATAGQTEVTFAFGRPTYGYGAAWRVYSSADGGATWTEVGGGDRMVPVIEELGGSPVQRRFTLAGYWVALSTGANNSGTTSVTFDTPRAAGEQLRLCWNPTFEAAGAQFFPNNLAEPIVRAAPVLENCAVFVDASFSAILTVAGGDAVKLDSGAVDGFWRPGAGNPLLTKATTGRRSALDLMGDAKPLTVAGALNTGTDLTRWDALPLPPTVTATWTAATFFEGDTVDADDIAVTIVDAGVPAVTTKGVLRSATITRGATAGSNPLEVNDVIAGQIRAPHLLLGRNEIALPQRVAQARHFERVEVANRGVAAIQLTDGTAPAIAAPVHVAFRARLAALPPATRRMFYSPDGLRMNIPSTGRINAAIGGANLIGFSASRVLEVGAFRSVLVSFWPNLGGPGGISARMIYDGRETATSKTNFGSAVPMAGLTLFGLGLASDGSYVMEAPDIVIDSWFGVWRGGDPAFGDFFDVGGGNAARDPNAIAVAGMAPAFLFSGLTGFNGMAPDNQPLNRGDYTMALGGLRRTVAAFT